MANILLQSRKSLNILIIGLVIILVISGAYIAHCLNQISSQNIQITALQKVNLKSEDKIKVLSNDNASISAQIEQLINRPTPTPQVIYNTQYVKPTLKCSVMANAYTHFTECCDAAGNCTASN